MNLSQNLERCLSFINYQVQPPSGLAERQARRAVTLSRQTGCGAQWIAEKLRDLLQQSAPADAPPWTVFDQNLIERILSDHKLPRSLSKFMPEDRVSWITDAMEELFGLHPSAETLVRKTAATILHLAELGHVILIGRGANVITSRLPQMLHVRLVGSVEKRIERLCFEKDQSRESALAFLRQEDEGRRRYLRTYYHKDIDDSMLYHLTLNTDNVSCDGAASLIARAVEMQ